MLCVRASRKVMYHGPVAGALPFFASLGFVCPVRKDPGSFLQEVTTPKGARRPHMAVIVPWLLVTVRLAHKHAEGLKTLIC